VNTSIATKNVEDTIKSLLSDPQDRIKLDDYVTGILRARIDIVTADTFWSSLPDMYTDGIQSCLSQFEDSMNDLLMIAILLGRWGQADQVVILEKVLLRLAEANKPSRLPSFSFCPGLAPIRTDSLPHQGIWWDEFASWTSDRRNCAMADG
jgi:hypothetical protein